MSSPPSPPNTFGDSLLCPVCFVMFEGRIIQCSQGHSVCEKCHRQLNNECPQCRSCFVGTRNYLLEDIIKQLKALKQMACPNPSTSDSNNGNADNGQANKVLEKFFQSIPKSSENETPSGASLIHTSGAMSILQPGLASSDETLDNITIAFIPHLTVAPTPAPNLNLHSSGLFECRMLECLQKLPACRLLNHIRCYHKDDLMQVRLPASDPEFVMHWTFPCASYRKAIQISKFGLFFFIVNVKKESQKYTANAWVQRVCPNSDARKFTFQIELRMGNQIGSFTDYVYGTQSGADYIQEKTQCLHMELNRRKLKQIGVDVKIMKTTRPTNLRRSYTTNITLVENAQPL